MNFDVEKIRNSMKEALKNVEKQYDIEINLDDIVVNGEETFIKTLIENSESVQLKRKEEFLKYYKTYGLCEDDFMKEYDFYGLKFKIIGIYPEYNKTPIYVEDETGRRYFANEISVNESIECCKKNNCESSESVIPF